MSPPPARPDGTPIRVTIVDDSVVVRGLFSRWLAAMPDVEIAGIHRNGLEAVRQIANVRPDVVILDIEMPEMDGLTALPLLLEASPGSRVLVVSGMSVRGADITLRCIMRGAVDYLAKPSTIHEGTSLDEFRDALMQRVRAVGARRAVQRGVPACAPVAGGAAETPVHAARPEPSLRAQTGRPGLIVIGASTGGPPVITDLFRHLAPVLPPVPIVVAQQMPATFSTLFADLLRRQAGVPAREILGGEEITAGSVAVCRGGQNMRLIRVAGRLMAQKAEGQDAAFGKPSIDLMFESAVEAAGGGVLGVILTGIGRDGLAGAKAIVEARGIVLCQDESSSAVWGTPGAVVQAGYASAILPVAELAARIRSFFLS